MVTGALIVGAEGRARGAVARLLGAAFVEVAEASDAGVALATIAGAGPAVALIDIDDEAPLGVDLIRRASSGEARTTPCIAFCEAPTEARRREALEAGAIDLVDPLRDAPLLRARVRTLIRRHVEWTELDGRRQRAQDLGLTRRPQADLDQTRVLIVGPRGGPAEGAAHAITSGLGVTCHIVSGPIAALRSAEAMSPDIVIFGDAALTARGSRPAGFAEATDPVDFIAALSNRAKRGKASAMMILAPDEPGRAAVGSAALDAGAADIVRADGDFHELVIRVERRIEEKRRLDRLRAEVNDGLRQAAVDPLTGLYNRRYLDTHFARRVARSRVSGEPLSALLFDIDHFKEVNDRCGHVAGDAALVAFSALLEAEVRSGDLVGRYGGEEFLVVMPGAALPQALAAAERVRERTEEGLLTPDAVFTVSAGVATMTSVDDDPADLLARADAALREAKTRGRNLVVGP